ncbi:MAG: regulatory protein RecX [Lishizhenia sp.]
MKSECKYSFLEAKHKIEAYCAYQDRCHYEVDQKLISWGFDQEDRGILAADLISNRFLDEERFARSFVSGKFRIKKWGRIKIKMHLKQKRVTDYSIKQGFREIDADEYWDTLLNLAKKKASEKKKGDSIWQQRAKITRFLSSRGFESDLIRDAVEHVLLSSENP